MASAKSWAEHILYDWGVDSYEVLLSQGIEDKLEDVNRGHLELDIAGWAKSLDFILSRIKSLEGLRSK